MNISLFRKNSFYNKIDSVTENKAKGGDTIMVNKSIPHSDVMLNTKFEAVAIRTSILKTITTCSIYLPPTPHWETKHLEELISELTPPFILMEDFNAHSKLWECDLTGKTGTY